MRRIKLFFLILVLIVGVLLGIWIMQDNSTPVELTVFGFALTALPLGILLIGTFFLGIFLALLATAFPVARARRKNLGLEKELRRLKSSA